MKKTLNTKTPWLWVPTTFFMEGLPASMIMLVLAIMYKNLGVSNLEITLYTGSMVLPWVIKPLWASLIDSIRTTRWWIYAMQIFVGLAFIIMSLSLKTQHFLLFSLTAGWFIAFMSSSHDIATDGFYIQNLSPEQQSYFIGMQSAAYNIGKVFATGLILMLCGVLYSINNDYVVSWSICLVLVGCVCIIMGIYHRKILPEQPVSEKKNTKETLRNFIDVYKTFFLIKNLWIGLAFIFLFKFSESMIGAILPLFMIDTHQNGGLNLGNTFTGFAYGTISPVAIILGGFVGGYYIYRKGFGSTIYTMFVLVNLPHILYVLLAYFQVNDHIVVILCVFVEQFSFSLGLTAAMLFCYFMVKDSSHKTAHYAFISGVLLLGRMIPVMISGAIESSVGYTMFFIITIILALPVVLILPKVKAMLGDYGKTHAKERKLG
ncbi:MFS transporter [Francisella adeliensis]|uniref:AmpG family muropeptide MFS transporter n=1 Tax=Francisella adeliensis TaxID=2007306 RepID=A0A2Z4Y0A3_9GAMM|nr:MFS transporter [Francisella adeliensis]AXA34474.1 hypothetical protein CDH04_08735 [Francisella adeliensis]MBK2086193.1 MFS transporter [Francisella adeliensis]MBK2096410.1 MFS transporter [Francisella adeliensis]QIW12721.1 AmpG family muropeptide MFS transporter [Francisella adeliensis]QIW14597.1 AmpG family muropeptide MFS transporter [Francisella adeliensis]